jgi:NAD(P)-dependent dehydrogenase (short-subunit alcohol dehydrogenase family)
VITGGAGLLGRAMALAFARQGMNIVLAGTEAENLETAARLVRQEGVDVLTVRTDVSCPEQMDDLAARSFDHFGQVNRLCLNAGVAILKPFDQLTRDDWNKVLGVHLGGVLNGITAFLPQLIQQGGDRHVVLSSSMAGVGRADLRLLNAPYVVSKFAITGMGEVMAPSLMENGIGVSILCPGMTVADPAAMRGVNWPMPSAAWYQDNLLDADEVASEMIAGIAERRLYIFSHRLGRDEVAHRHAKVMEGFDQAEHTSPPLSRG